MFLVPLQYMCMFVSMTKALEVMFGLVWFEFKQNCLAQA
jgi:hypothetical protein